MNFQDIGTVEALAEAACDSKFQHGECDTYCDICILAPKHRKHITVDVDGNIGISLDEIDTEDAEEEFA